MLTVKEGCGELDRCLVVGVGAVPFGSPGASGLGVTVGAHFVAEDVAERIFLCVVHGRIRLAE